MKHNKYKHYYSQKNHRPMVSLKAYDSMEKALNTSKYEYGGYFEHDPKVNELNVDYVTGGSKDSISLPISTYEFHTHPNKCYSKHNCALGMPSLPDMLNIFDRCTQKNECHFVFAHEGSFVVGVKNEFRNLYLRDPKLCAQDRKGLKGRLKTLYDKFDKSSRMSYKEFLQIWLRYINAADSYFRVDYFPKYIGPTVPSL